VAKDKRTVAKDERTTDRGHDRGHAELVSPRDAAELVGVSQRTLRRRMADKTLTVTRDAQGRVWLDKAQLLDLYATKAARGRPVTRPQDRPQDRSSTALMRPLELQRELAALRDALRQDLTQQLHQPELEDKLETLGAEMRQQRRDLRWLTLVAVCSTTAAAVAVLVLAVQLLARGT